VNSYVWTKQGLDGYYSTLGILSSTKYKVKGVKVVLDGSIQGYTALMTKPYWVTE
jgi:predicted amidohydrolase YtcJ